VDVNAIMPKNKKKRKGTSSITPKKVITEVSLPQEGETNETTENISKPTKDVVKLVAASNVMNKVVEVVVEEEQNLKDADTKQTLEVEVLEEEVVEDQIVEEKPLTLEDDVVVIINQMGKIVCQQEEPYHQQLEREIL